MYYDKRATTFKLISEHSRRQRKREVFTGEEKQLIMKHISRMEFFPDKKNRPNDVFKPPLAEFVKDLALIFDHIFSYEFNTFSVEKSKSKAKNVFPKLAAALIDDTMPELE